MIHSAGAGVKTPARIPFAFRADPVALDGLKLDPTARAAFVLILDNAKAQGWRSRLSNVTIGRILGRCPMTISRALRRLEAAGLILRELAAGGRVRTGIVVTWEGVRREGLTGQASLRREDLTGPTLAPKGVRREWQTNQNSPQSQDQMPPFLPPGKDPGEVPDPATAAAYLRSLVEAGRRGRSPAPPCPAAQAVAASPTPAAPAPRPTPPAGPSRTHQDEPRAIVERMAESVFKDARRAAWGPLPGRRRMTPAELQKQLLEVRRKYGGKTPPAATCDSHTAPPRG